MDFINSERKELNYGFFVMKNLLDFTNKNSTIYNSTKFFKAFKVNSL